MSRQSTKNKKYALRKIGKYFGSCVVATVITLGGVAMMAPNVTVYASGGESGENQRILILYLPMMMAIKSLYLKKLFIEVMIN